jgi:hypothetical protein
VPDPDDFVIMYAHKGAVRKYSPDCIVRLNNGAHLILVSFTTDMTEEEAENYASYPSYADYLERRKEADKNARRFLKKIF